MKAILLAAGLGSRLGTLTHNKPKAAIEIGQLSLVRRAIRFIQHISLDEIIVVGGYKSQRLWNELKDEHVTHVDNPDFYKGNFYSLASARKYFNDDFVLLNVDHLYPSHLARIINEISEGVWAVTDFDRPLYHDDMKVRVSGRLNHDACVSAISKELDKYDGGYCGITVVKGKALNNYITAFNNVLNHAREQAVVEDILAELIRLSFPPNVLDISGIRWLEIDTQDDLANAERILRMKPHFLD